jgi:glycosyltransferase involved in cell wall biosynthesis
LAVSLAIERSVDFLGIVPDLSSIFQKTGVFALSSRYEGFPNALMEAMACGLPVVSFDCPSGPAEIIRTDQDGFLVPAGNVERFAVALRSLMAQSELRSRMADSARNVADRFSADTVRREWERVLTSAAAPDVPTKQAIGLYPSETPEQGGSAQ